MTYTAKGLPRYFIFILIFSLGACRTEPNQASSPQASLISHENVNIDDAITDFIDSNHLPGLVLIVKHKGEIVKHQAYGYANIEKKVPMSKDAIFRLFSMTKAITSVVTLETLKRHNMTVDEPIQNVLPSFSNVPDMPIHTLLNHTSGLSYGFKINRWAGWLYLFANLGASSTLDEFIAKLSDLPLLSEPGARWRYSYSSDVLGAAIEKLNNESLTASFNKLVFSPLTMKDTGFYLSNDAAPRLVPMYTNAWFSEFPKQVDLESNITQVPTAHSGGGGLFSTAADYMKFVDFLLSESPSHSSLDSKMASKITKDQLPAGIEKLPPRLYNKSSFGYGVGVKLENDGRMSPGSFFWAGKGGTTFWADPQQELAVVAMMQMEGGRKQLEDNLIPLVYQWIKSL